MLIPRGELDRIARGEITLAFRRWKRPTVRAGGTLRTAVGILAIDAVDVVAEDEISEAEAARAGFASLPALRDALRRHDARDTYRISLRFAGADPREALRQQANLDSDDVAQITRRLARWDRASPQGPWTAEALRLISERPATRAPDLAAAAGFEARWFKTKVRQLKELGLTESLAVGYRLSPRGAAYLRAAATGD